ncbi:MFS transporter [Kitasatospora sp. NPDC058218]|uniref:MFS transporter n=1 Tax=Kitasatospora sp. NPDC058218 TaxID=3346385 RepID=UPI0036DEF31D
MTTSVEPAGKAGTRLGLVLLACCVGQFMVVLDASIVNVALRPIQEDLDLAPNTLQWVINAYTIVFAGFLLLGGRLADLFGRRRVFAVGLALFTLASLVAGVAVDPTTLLISRGLQGLGGAVLAPATLTVLFTTYTDPMGKAKAFGTWSAVAAGGGAIGALLGGVVTQWLSWRWIFLVNVPIGILLMALLLTAVPESRNENADRRIDSIGAVLVTGGLMAVVYGIVESHEKGWDSATTIVSLAVGIALLVLFVVNEAKFAKQPLVPLSIFANRSVSAANIVNFTTSAALVGVLFLFTLLMQFVYGYGSLETGLAYLPLSLGIVATARGLAPSLINKFGPKPVLVTGSILSMASLLWLSAVVGDGGFVSDLLGPSLVFGAGQGMVSSTVTMAGTAKVPYTQAGLVSGLLNASRQVGGALWLSVLAAVVAGYTNSLTPGASADGYSTAFLIAAVYPLVGALAGLAVPGVSPEALAAARNWGAAKKPAATTAEK